MNIHSKARTCPNSRAVIVEHIRASAWSEDVAQTMGISSRTGYKWSRRYREEGAPGLQDRSCRPLTSPTATAADRVDMVVKLRRTRLTGREIANKLRMPRSTVAAILKRAGLSRLRDLDPPAPVIRYERDTPGDLIHLDIKKLGRIQKIGHRITGDRRGQRGAGWEYVHVAIDDASRLAYVEVLTTQRADHTAGFLRRALIFFRRHGIKVKSVMTDNGSAYVSHLFRSLCESNRLRHLRTRPYRPCTNGKAERLIQTLLREWAYKRPYRTSRYRTNALVPWLNRYNHHRPHSSLGGISPIARVAAQC